MLPAILAPSATAQGSRKDDIVPGPTGTPCSPLATIYTDATLTATAPNPLQTDGLIWVSESKGKQSSKKGRACRVLFPVIVFTLACAVMVILALRPSHKARSNESV